MKVRVKRDMMAYLNNRRYREGQVVDIPEKSLKKADKAHVEKAAAKGEKGVKLGDPILPKWAELASKPVSTAEPRLPGTPGQVPEPEEESEGKAGQDVI